ncbi:hypothetical protein LZ30DRAFT_221433 [Colletotrichum cereale]|nr:hypothetical protein LZ30DRAFT_221433 [Colletotrichum cereale]
MVISSRGPGLWRLFRCPDPSCLVWPGITPGGGRAINRGHNLPGWHTDSRERNRCDCFDLPVVGASRLQGTPRKHTPFYRVGGGEGWVAERCLSGNQKKTTDNPAGVLGTGTFEFALAGGVGYDLTGRRAKKGGPFSLSCPGYPSAKRHRRIPR